MAKPILVLSDFYGKYPTSFFLDLFHRNGTGNNEFICDASTEGARATIDVCIEIGKYNQVVNVEISKLKCLSTFSPRGAFEEVGLTGPEKRRIKEILLKCTSKDSDLISEDLFIDHDAEKRVVEEKEKCRQEQESTALMAMDKGDIEGFSNCITDDFLGCKEFYEKCYKKGNPWKKIAFSKKIIQDKLAEPLVECVDNSEIKNCIELLELGAYPFAMDPYSTHTVTHTILRKLKDDINFSVVISRILDLYPNAFRAGEYTKDILLHADKELKKKIISYHLTNGYKVSCKAITDYIIEKYTLADKEELLSFANNL